MKKLLLSFGACALAMSASAVTIDNILPAEACDFENGELYQYWLESTPNVTYGWSNYAQGGNDMTFSVVEGGYDSEYCIMADNLTAGSDYYLSQISYTFEQVLEKGDYAISFWAKSSVENASIQVAYQSNINWDGGLYREVALTTDWQQYQIQFSIEKDQINTLQFNLGKVVGKYYFDDFAFGPIVNDTPTTVPENAVVVATFYKAAGFTGDWSQIFNDWSNGGDGEGERVYEEDGYPCYMFTNPTPEETWNGWYYQAQLHDLDLKAGTEYYVNFMVKGTEPAVGLGGFASGEGENTDLTTYNVTNDWEFVTVSVKPTDNCTSILLNLGAYVGTLYITDVTVYYLNEDETGVQAFQTADNAEKVIYNLNGMRVNENNLTPGLYIINGKKVMIRK